MNRSSTTSRRDSPRYSTALAAASTVVCSLPLFLTAVVAVQLRDDLGVGTVGIGAAAGAFFGTLALASVHLGRVADRLGALLSLRIATLVASASSLGISVSAVNWVTLAAWLVACGAASSLALPASHRLLIGRVRIENLATAFGANLAAPPAASMVAGILVPALAVSMGWRWAYALTGVAGLLLSAGIALRTPEQYRSNAVMSRTKSAPLKHRSTLMLLAVAFGLAFATSSVVLVFYVDAAILSGSSHSQAGFVFAGASLVATLTRLTAGLACDRRGLDPLRLSAGLLVAGALGLGLMATDRPVTMGVGVVLGLTGTWGFYGVFWFALVRAYSASPGRITGTMAPAAVGGIIGPIGFGALVTSSTYSLAWAMTGVTAAFAAVVMLVGGRRLSLFDRPTTGTS